MACKSLLYSGRSGKWGLMLFLILISSTVAFPQSFRQTISLNENWYTIAGNAGSAITPDTRPGQNWKHVNIPHNWDDYEGYRRLRHGNLHDTAWYHKTFTVRESKNKKRFFLFFEGVGSYATVYLNGMKVGAHAGGRTTFTLDITGAVKANGSINNLLVRADHPANIRDLPWVCGGCSNERGFSEGSQPLGIFRPVQLIITGDARVEPFGVHAWSETNAGKTQLNINTTLKNYSSQRKEIEIINRLINQQGKTVTSIASKETLTGNDSLEVSQKNIAVNKPVLWWPENPYLYKIITIVKENNVIIDKTETEFGFRTVSWKDPSNRFFINGKPVFINGVAEYEHLLGQSHAFSRDQIVARMKWLQAAGFNAFRDAHQPHNLLYGKLCNRMGILWWTQFSAHIWFDTPEFRKNFLQLLKLWVIERRNDPSVVMWGLQNESRLPEDFAKQCTELIRQLDPTTSAQRLVVTCNGGTGTDWDVPQNWTGTYGGNPYTYDRDLVKQVLVGEYGAWRTLDLHTEGGFVQDGILSEDRMTQLMELKVRLAESVKDSVAGHYFWLLTSHDNPGRVQGGEGLRGLDRIGPVNYKGLLTPWEEPLDVFYMFRANYAPKETAPMVYIVSHTWPSRWLSAGKKDSITVYSNCDEVELFNDVNDISLGKKQRNGPGTHFQWDNVPVQYNVLYAVGYVNGKAVARDTIVLHHLPRSPHFNRLYANAQPVTRPEPGYHYIYRINCGGPEYKDESGNTWLADRAIFDKQFATDNKQLAKRKRSAGVSNTPVISQSVNKGWYSRSWTTGFENLPPCFASQRRTFAPIRGTRDWQLFQDFRYGKHQLQYVFPLPDGEYRVELYFTEPWIGVGGGMNGEGMRLFDVAINGKTVLNDLDIWKESGTNRALKKVVHARVEGGKMVITFPESRAAQAIISAIAIAAQNTNIRPAPAPSLVENISCRNCVLATWLDLGRRQYADTTISFYKLPSQLFGADYLRFSYKNSSPVAFTVKADAEVFAGMPSAMQVPEWLKEFENTQTKVITDENEGKEYTVFRKRFPKGSTVSLPIDHTYLVMIKPVSNMQPAYDLKPVTQYRTNVAMAGNGMVKKTFAGRACAVATGSEEASVQWPVSTGLADRYSVTVKYHYSGTDTLQAKLQWMEPDNTLLHEEWIPIMFTRPGKWNQYTINTASMINAGNYNIRLTVKNAKNLAVSGIDIQ